VVNFKIFAKKTHLKNKIDCVKEIGMERSADHE